ncbi:MAG: phosphoribosylaminoimidazolesuccinocarboxamide synthase [Mariprofundaceae bacterium]|nr:phosphoribosylaminoimidazolesuccinocarboxamide synthase [Mariprofundaceae bacterium]
MMKQNLKYEGKGKALYSTDDEAELIQVFKDDATAFDGKKHDTITGKGILNCAISTFFFKALEDIGIKTHFIRREADTDMRIRALSMMPVEVVVRNVAAGSICKRLGLEEGLPLKRPLTELFYKDDALGDPMINTEHCELFGWATAEQVRDMRKLALSVNAVMSNILEAAGIRLIDFKLEFGLLNGEIILGDEISPDGCRLWDIKTNRKLDKDVFRRDLGGLSEVYHEVATRLGIKIQF